MNDYIIGWIMVMCLFYISIGEQDRMGRAVIFRTDPLLANSPAGT